MTSLTPHITSTGSLSPDIVFDLSDHPTVVRSFLTSGLSQKAFCKQHDLKLSTFKNWVYRYHRRPVDQTSLNSSKDIPFSLPSPIAPVAPQPLFMPIHVTPDEAQGQPMPDTSSRCSLPSSSLSSPPPFLRLDTGCFSLTIPVGFDPDTLSSVLSIVKAAV